MVFYFRGRMIGHPSASSSRQTLPVDTNFGPPAPSTSGNLLEATLPFIVLEQSAETQQPLPDFGLMNQLAAITESSGGCLLAEEDVDIAMDRLAERRMSAIVELVQSYRLGDGTFDSWIFSLFTRTSFGPMVASKTLEPGLVACKAFTREHA